VQLTQVVVLLTGLAQGQSGAFRQDVFRQMAQTFTTLITYRLRPAAV
jgi:hypothetical protein